MFEFWFKWAECKVWAPAVALSPERWMQCCPDGDRGWGKEEREGILGIGKS